MSKKKYDLHIGRFQPFHEGHLWLFNQSLSKGKNVCVAIRDVEVNENQPWDAETIMKNVEVELYDLIQEGKIKLIIIPDIESINYGRGVGYEIIEHIPPTDIKEISATKIRQELREQGKL